MTFDSFQEKWQSVMTIGDSNGMTRVDDVHQLDLFIGSDNSNRYQLMLISEFEPKNIMNSRAIHTSAGKRQDGRWAICFVLFDNTVEEEFMRLCWNMVEVSRGLSKSQDDINFIMAEFEKWQKMMELGSNGILSLNEAKGLVGELFFLEKYAIKNYGEIVAVQGWMGPNKADRDFIYADSWFEVKSVDPSATDVTISSIEQLDIDIRGQLVVYFLETTAITSPEAISLSGQVKAVRQICKQAGCLLAFENKLNAFGYIDRKEYDEYVFAFRGKTCFNVDSTFPRLRRALIPAAVQKASYSIGLSSIEFWKII